MKGYERLADAVDGDAYYWSSVNPDTFPGYRREARGHGERGPRSRTDCGSRRRRRASMRARSRARRSCSARRRPNACCASARPHTHRSPTSLGLISWNEFTENTYIEPSKKYGALYLHAATRCRPGSSGLPIDGSGSHYGIDSSAPGHGFPSGLVVVPVTVAMMGGAVLVSVRRRRQGPSRPVANAASSKTTS